MNWYRKLTAQVEAPQAAPAPNPAEPPQGAAQCDPVNKPSAPEPSPAMVQQIAQDFIKGRNVSRLANSVNDVKVAGVTGHWRHTSFIDAFSKLPNNMKDFVRDNFKRMVANPTSVNLKPVNAHRASQFPVYSAQVGAKYRALAVKVGDQYIWYWIGTHNDYDKACERNPPSSVPTVVPQPGAQQKGQPQQQKPQGRQPIRP